MQFTNLTAPRVVRLGCATLALVRCPVGVRRRPTWVRSFHGLLTAVAAYACLHKQSMTQRPGFGLPDVERGAFIAAYGHDIRSWDGYPVMRHRGDVHAHRAAARWARRHGGPQRAAHQVAFASLWRRPAVDSILMTGPRARWRFAWSYRRAAELAIEGPEVAVVVFGGLAVMRRCPACGEVQLPGHAEAVVHPAELGAETVRAQRHQLLALLGEPAVEAVDLGAAVALDIQRHRGREAELVLGRAIDAHERLAGQGKVACRTVPAAPASPEP